MFLKIFDVLKEDIKQNSEMMIDQYTDKVEVISIGILQDIISKLDKEEEKRIKNGFKNKE